MTEQVEVVETKQRKPRRTGPRSGLLNKVISQLSVEPKTISQINEGIPEFNISQISSACSYLIKKGKIAQSKIPRVNKVGRKEVNAYVLIV